MIIDAFFAYYWRHYRVFLYPSLAIGGLVSIPVMLSYALAPEWSKAVDLMDRTFPLVGVASALAAVNFFVWIAWSAHQLTRGKKYASIATIASAGFMFACTQGIVLLFVSYSFGWFSNLVVDQAETNKTVLLIVLDTASKGAFLDLMESYGLTVSHFRPEQGALVFGTIIFVYRTLWSLLAAATAFVIANWLSRSMRRPS